MNKAFLLNGIVLISLGINTPAMAHDNSFLIAGNQSIYIEDDRHDDNTYYEDEDGNSVVIDRDGDTYYEDEDGNVYVEDEDGNVYVRDDAYNESEDCVDEDGDDLYLDD
jgi:hypothetical protein